MVAMVEFLQKEAFFASFVLPLQQTFAYGDE
jgi:hypothetical protein